MIKTPVVLIIFNRKETTEQVFQAIRQAQPTQLFVISDAPRPHHQDDLENCEEVRKIIDKVDWNCQVIKNYSSVNLGIRKRFETGLNWVFKQVEEAIIFEHDCLPHSSFFPFCETLLNYYKNEPKIMHIGGNNFQFGRHKTPESYYFSRYPHIWGWATWGRAWQFYDANMKLWDSFASEQWLQQLFDHSKTVTYWNDTFQKTYDNLINTWDYQWTFACWLQGGLSIIPNVNLVTNIGFGEAGTYTLDAEDILANIPTQEMVFPLCHPTVITHHEQADRFTQDHIFQRSLKDRIQAKLKKIKKFVRPPVQNL